MGLMVLTGQKSTVTRNCCWAASFAALGALLGLKVGALLGPGLGAEGPAACEAITAGIVLTSLPIRNV